MNDNKPVFTSSQTILPVSENQPIGVVIYTVQATDLDSDSNGRVRYQLTRNTDQMFQIDPVSGGLSVKVSFLVIVLGWVVG